MPSPRRRALSAAYLLWLLLLQLVIKRKSISLEMIGAGAPAKRGRPPHPCRLIITPHRQNALTGTCAYCGNVVPFDVDSSTSHIVFLCPSISDSARTPKGGSSWVRLHACLLLAQQTRCAAGTARLAGHCTFSETHQPRWPPSCTALRPYKGVPPMWKRILRHLCTFARLVVFPS